MLSSGNDTSDKSFPVLEGEEFSISFIHSVNQSLVTEFFEIRQGQITLSALEFESFGAGMPTELEPGQYLTRLPGGIMRIDGFNRSATGLHFLIGRETNHTLYVSGQSIPLKQGSIYLTIFSSEERE